MSAASTAMTSVQALDFEDNCLLIRHGRLYAVSVRRTSVLPAASFRFHLAMDTLAVRLTVPLAGPVLDFDQQVSAPCRAHNKKRRAKAARRFSFETRPDLNDGGLPTAQPPGWPCSPFQFHESVFNPPPRDAEKRLPPRFYRRLGGFWPRTKLAILEKSPRLIIDIIFAHDN